MRKHIDRTEIQKLISTKPKSAVSIVMPLSQKETKLFSKKTNSDKLKKLIDKAEKQIVKQDNVNPEILEPIKDIADSEILSKIRAEGVAFYLSENGLSHYFLSNKPSELVVVNSEFHLRPLLAQMNEDTNYVILAISESSVRLLKANKNRVQNIAPESMPESLEVVRIALKTLLNTEDSPPTRVGVRKNSDDELKAYVRIIEKTIHPILRSEGLPVILAATPKLQGMFRSVSSYHNLMAESLSFDPEVLSESELQHYAWQIVKHKLPEYRSGRSKYRMKIFDVREILSAAFQGRIHSLYLNPSTHVWGRLKTSQSGAFVSHTTPREGDVDLLSVAALQTHQHHGQIVEAEASEITHGFPVMAILRY